ncbi:MAG: GNAT family N-acetyltransferase [Chloroflexi bacterium]|nr:GNAT family N-acetyltransferase [Chloroflexota bacterium]
MAAGALSLKKQNGSGLRPVDLRRDLGHVAALMELCFGETLDAGGRGTMREMQMLSRSGFLQWIMGTVAPAWQHGFVWVEDGRLVGNVSTQPSEAERRAWLVANVAVHPDYRRRGIARALTEAALQLAAEHGATQTLLQVNHDNTGARQLYDSLNFQFITARTVWERVGRFQPQPLSAPGVEIRPERSTEWQAGFELASTFRPEGFLWAHPLRREDWRPLFWRRLGQALSGQREERWVAVEAASGRLVGFFGLSLMFGPVDHIDLLIHPDWQTRLERPLLVTAIRRLHERRWPVRLDHPFNEAEAPLRELGFRATQSLVWMKKSL